MTVYCTLHMIPIAYSKTRNKILIKRFFLKCQRFLFALIQKRLSLGNLFEALHVVVKKISPIFRIMLGQEVKGKMKVTTYFIPTSPFYFNVF